MTKLIAVNTVQGASEKLHKDAHGEQIVDRHGRPRRTLSEVVIKPGESFDSADLGMDDDEVAALVAAGAAREASAISARAKKLLASPPPAGGGIDDVSGASGGTPSQEDLEAMTRAELEALASDWGVDVSKAKNKPEVIAILTEALAA